MRLQVPKTLLLALTAGTAQITSRDAFGDDPSDPAVLINSVIFLVKLNLVRTQNARPNMGKRELRPAGPTGASRWACGGNSKPNVVLGASETLFPRRRSAGALRAFYEHKRDYRVHNPRFAGLLEIESIPSKCLLYFSIPNPTVFEF
jgi:hypothetical protein